VCGRPCPWARRTKERRNAEHAARGDGCARRKSAPNKNAAYAGKEATPWRVGEEEEEEEKEGRDQGGGRARV